MPKHWGVVLAIALGVATACGGGGSDTYGGTPTSPPPATPSNPATPNTVLLGASSFSPAVLNVAVGSTVTWVWAPCTGGDGYGGVCPTHSVTFDDGSEVTSGVLSTGQFKRTFSAAGTYEYHCAIHGAAAMSGEIRVQ